MSRITFTAAGALAIALSVSACDAVTETAGPTDAATPKRSAPASGAAQASQAAPLSPSGPAELLTPEEARDEALQSAANVVRVDWVGDDQAKLFGTAGGDPAMNGLYAYIAFFVSPAASWTIYRLGDVLDYTVLSSSPGRVDLDIHESTMNDATGEVGSRHRKVIVQWSLSSEADPPTSVTVTPAG